MKKTLHIITRKLQNAELDKISSSPIDLVYFDLPGNIYDLPNTVYRSSLLPGQKKLINYRIMEQLLELGSKKINGRIISDIMEHEYINFWFYQRLTIYMAARNLEYILEEARLASKDYSVTLYTSIPAYILSSHLPAEVRIIYSETGNYRRKVSGIGLAMLYSLPAQAFKSTARIAGKHLVIDNARPVRIYKEANKGNFVLHNLFKKLDNRFCLIREAGLPGKRTARISDFRSSAQYKSLHLNNISSDLILFRALLSPGARKDIKNIRILLGKSLLLLKNEFEGTEYSVLVYLLCNLDSAFRIYITRYVGFKKICRKHRPLSVTASDENSPYNKSLLDAAKSLGIKTIGLQHGAIHELHPAYRLTKEEAAKDLTPDLTLVWGEYWKKLLIETGNYSESAIRVTGQIRTDTIPLMAGQREKESKENVILFASQPQRDPSLRKKAAADLFEAAASIKGIAIVLKPHPLEKDYLDYYSSIARDKGLARISYRPDGDLYELISCSDGVFTCFSTVGAEAIYFSKPLIIHDPLEQDIQGYISAGVGHRVRNTEECRAALIKLAGNSLVHKPASVSSFIRNYAFKIDGKVAERVIAEITGAS